MEKPIISLEDVSFRYANRSEATLHNLSFTVKRGEFILLTGSSGCGKSTLLRLLNGLIPHESGGDLQGKITIDGLDTVDTAVADISRIVGMVFQSPEDQIFASTIFDEVAFVLENMGLPQKEIAKRVSEALVEVGLAGLETNSIHALSGGQKQRLAVAAVLAAKPAVLALDEPISQVDPVNAANLLELLVRLNREENVTIMLIEHRLHEVLHLCSRVLLIKDGCLIKDVAVDIAIQQAEMFRNYGLRLPQVLDICSRLAVPFGQDVTIVSQTIKRKYPNITRFKSQILKHKRTSAESLAPLVSLQGVSFAYEESKKILNSIDLEINSGEIIALMGSNGAGKSTLLQHIAGILEPNSGKIYFADGQPPEIGKCGFVMQNPDFMLFNKTVRDEILFAPRQFSKADSNSRFLFKLLTTRLSLEELADEFPLSLSRGQRLRVAIAAVMAANPQLLLLDEPTTGQDISRIDDILDMVKTYVNRGGTVIFCTHDTEVAASFAQRILLMRSGSIIADGTPFKVLSDSVNLQMAGLKEPPAMQIAQQLGWGELVSAKEVAVYAQSANLRSCSG